MHDSRSGIAVQAAAWQRVQMIKSWTADGMVGKALLRYVIRLCGSLAESSLPPLSFRLE